MATDYIASINRRQHVIDQLNQYGGQKKAMGSGSTFVQCPFHSESTPSCRVFHSELTKAPGYYKCYGCPAKGPWDEIAPLLGLQTFVRKAPGVEYASTSMLFVERDDSGLDDMVMDPMTLSDLPPNKVWRGIKTNLLIELGARRCVVHADWGDHDPMLYLPVFVNKELRGYIKARFRKKEGAPSYINAKGPWSKTHGLFPFDFAVAMARKLGRARLVLVEGPRDALRLLQLGIPAVCTLGTQSWSDRKAAVIELSGIRTLLPMMDGDCAGIAASAMLCESARSMFIVKEQRIWKIPGNPYLQFVDHDEPSKAAKKAGVSLWDPGNIPEQYLFKLRKKYFSPRV